MPTRDFRSFIPLVVSILIWFFFPTLIQAQGAKQQMAETPIGDSDRDHVQQRNEWFSRGRLIPGRPVAELRRRLRRFGYFAAP